MIYNFKFLFRINPYILMIFTFFSMLIFYLVGIAFIPRSIQYKNYEASAFVSITPQQTNTGDNTFYHNFIFMDVVYDDQIIPANYYMLTEGSLYDTNYLMLNVKDQMYLETLDAYTLGISNNLAKAHGLNIGDQLTISRLDQNYNYEIKYIFPEYFGDTQFNPNHYGLIILSYNDEIINSYNTHQYISYESTTGFYNPSSLLKNHLMQTLNIEMYSSIGVLIFVLLANYVLIETLFANRVNKDIHVIKNYLYTTKQVRLYILIQSIYKYGWIHLGSCTMLIVLGLIDTIHWFHFIYFIIGSIICYILIEFYRFNYKRLS